MSSIKFCKCKLEMEESAVIDLSNYLREVCAAHLLANPMRIGGPDMVVEIDESLFARRKNHVGRLLPEQWVFSGYCRDTNECFLFAVPDHSAATLIPLVRDNVLPGSTVMSDQWAAYGGLANFFQHQTVNHMVNFIDPATGAHTQGVERLWAAPRNEISITMGPTQQCLTLICVSLCGEHAWLTKIHLKQSSNILLTFGHQSNRMCILDVLLINT